MWYVELYLVALKQYLHNNTAALETLLWTPLVLLDKQANALLGGDPQETISSRAGKRIASRKWAKWLCKKLHKLDPEHCERNIDLSQGSDAISVVIRDWKQSHPKPENKNAQ